MINHQSVPQIWNASLTSPKSNTNNFPFLEISYLHPFTFLRLLHPIEIWAPTPWLSSASICIVTVMSSQLPESRVCIYPLLLLPLRCSAPDLPWSWSTAVISLCNDLSHNEENLLPLRKAGLVKECCQAILFSAQLFQYQAQWSNPDCTRLLEENCQSSNL